MQVQHRHLDEISVWTWIATLAFVLIGLAAAFIGTQEKMQLATDINVPGVPIVHPALLPPSAPDGRA